MKTTIKTRTKDVIVAPSVIAGLISVTVASNIGEAAVASVQLTPDQAGALIFGLEQALEAQEVAGERDKTEKRLIFLSREVIQAANDVGPV